MSIGYEDAPDPCDALEKFVFGFTLLLPMTDKRDRDVVIRGNLSRATADLVARQFLLQILTVNSRLRPVDSDCRRTFRINFFLELTADQKHSHSAS